MIWAANRSCAKLLASLNFSEIRGRRRAGGRDELDIVGLSRDRRHQVIFHLKNILQPWRLVQIPLPGAGECITSPCMYYILALLTSWATWGSPTDYDAIASFYRQILSCPNVNLTCLKAFDLVEEIRPNLFVLKNSVNLGTDEEWKSGARIAEWFDHAVLLAPHLPGLRGVPTVDAVVFSPDGRPLANLSLKALVASSSHDGHGLRKVVLRNQSSYKAHYNVDYLAGSFGLSVAESGELVADRGTPYQEYRKLVVRGVHHFLGLGRLSARDLWLAGDLIEDDDVSVRIFDDALAQTFIDLLNTREPDAEPSVLHLQSLSAMAGVRGEVSRYLILINDSYVGVDERGYVFVEDCAHWLAG